MKTLFLALALALIATVVHAEDWTVQGKIYQNVTVTKVEPDAVHIMYEGGIGSVKLSDLSPDLQKRFNYDPKAAQEATQQKAAQQVQAEAAESPKIVDAIQMRQGGQSAQQTQEYNKAQRDKQIADLKRKIAQEQAAIQKAQADYNDLTVQLSQRPTMSRRLEINEERQADNLIFRPYSDYNKQLAQDQATLAQLQQSQ
jgi:hypothetical protein